MVSMIGLCTTSLLLLALELCPVEDQRLDNMHSISICVDSNSGSCIRMKQEHCGRCDSSIDSDLHLRPQYKQNSSPVDIVVSWGLLTSFVFAALMFESSSEWLTIVERSDDV